MSLPLDQATGGWTLRLTDLGRHTLWATVLVLLASLLVPAFGALCTLVCLQIVGLVMALVLRPKVSLSCDVPGRLIVGQEATVRLQVRNDSNRPSYDLVCGLESVSGQWHPEGGTQVIESLAPGQSREWSYRLVPQQRGRHDMGRVVCRSSFPLNLVSMGSVLSSVQTLLVLPAFNDLDALTFDSSADRSSDRLRRLGQAGAYPEYLGNRPYLPGDPPRRIDARAWARLSVPAVREFQETGTPCVGLFLDIRVPARDARARDAFEAAISLCASLACSASRSCSVEWFIAGSQVHGLDEVPAAERFDRIHEVLAEVEPAGPAASQDLNGAASERLAAVSAVVFVLLSLDEQQRQRISQAHEAGCHSLAMVVADKAGESPGSEDSGVIWVSPSQAREGQVRL